MFLLLLMNYQLCYNLFFEFIDEMMGVYDKIHEYYHDIIEIHCCFFDALNKKIIVFIDNLLTYILFIFIFIVIYFLFIYSFIYLLFY